MSAFTDVLDKINIASQIALAVEPAIQEWSTDHVKSVQDIIITSAAGVGALDPALIPEVTAAAQLAVTVVPLVFGIFSLFKHNTPTPPPLPPVPKPV